MDIESNQQDSLRTEVEAGLAHAPLKLVQPQPGEELLHELMHELRVHQIELEMQNEELRRTQIVLEEARDRYVNLYEFAPVGYLTLTSKGVIAEVNLTASALLGLDRKELLKRHFSSFITHDDGNQWHKCFMSVLQHDGHQSCELAFKRGDGSVFDAQLDCLHMVSLFGIKAPLIFAVMAPL